MLWLVTLPLAVWYFSWLLHPDRVGHPVLYGLLLACEFFNVTQAFGFWWTCSKAKPRPHVTTWTDDLWVDVLIPTCGEPMSVVEPTVVAARAMRGARVRVWLLDDGPSPEARALAHRLGTEYVRRPDRRGAKAGSLNNALALSSAPFVVVFDCDHVPHPSFLERTLGHMADERVAFVQTPQYYANARYGGVASGAWGQQALFFGPIARGKDGLRSTFCCGTNVVFRRSALLGCGGFPSNSLTEDFELSIALHEQGWTSVYVAEVLASGLGPEDMASYVSQQHRWARGCLGAAGRVVRSALPARIKLQYLLSSMFFLTGWTFLIYMSLPVIRLLTGAQPVAAASADQFLLHFLPYFSSAIGAVAVAGEGRYTFEAFTLMVANFWVHVHASLRTLLGKAGSFVVTPKEGAATRQPRAVAPTLVAIGVLTATALVGLWRDQSAGTLNNVAFALMHVAVLGAGAWPALRRGRPATTARTETTAFVPPQPQPTYAPALRHSGGEASYVAWSPTWDVPSNAS
jgi:cellulose synthase (UDP-forming)